MHYYPHHIGDFIRDTARLSDAQCMAYLRLIWAYYDTEKPLTDDPESLAFQIGSTADVVRQILAHYFQKTDEGWRHTRCDSVINDYHGKQDKARKSANARWKDANAMRAHTERNANATKNDANQEPITNNQKKEREKRSPIGSRLPADWVCPDSWMDFCRSTRPDLDPEVTACRFADYWHSVAGARGRKADWSATWRNWVRNEKAVASQQTETAYQRSMRLRMQEVAPEIAKRSPQDLMTFDITEIEHGTPPRLG